MGRRSGSRDWLQIQHHVLASVLTMSGDERRTKAQKTGGRQAKPQRTPDGQEWSANYWGITKEQLRDLYKKCSQDSLWSDCDNVRTFVDKFVKPMTKGSFMGVSLLLNQDSPKFSDLMISHSWDENAKLFFEDLERFMENGEVAFICFLALFQGTPDDIAAQLGESIQDGP